MTMTSSESPLKKKKKKKDGNEKKGNSSSCHNILDAKNNVLDMKPDFLCKGPLKSHQFYFSQKSFPMIQLFRLSSRRLTHIRKTAPCELWNSRVPK